MDNETIYILPDCSTQLPKQFKTWIDFYDFIKKDWNGQEEIVHFAEYLTPRLAEDKPRITKYYMTYVKSKCFEEQENFRVPDFTVDELIYLSGVVRMAMGLSPQNNIDVTHKIYSMIDLKHKEIMASKEKVAMP